LRKQKNSNGSEATNTQNQNSKAKGKGRERGGARNLGFFNGAKSRELVYERRHESKATEIETEVSFLRDAYSFLFY
jgi:hypothetical protein